MVLVLVQVFLLKMAKQLNADESIKVYSLAGDVYIVFRRREINHPCHIDSFKAFKFKVCLFL